MSLNDDAFGGGMRARLTGRYPKCGTRRAQAAIRAMQAQEGPGANDDALERIDNLLERKEAALERVRQHLRLKALLEIAGEGKPGRRVRLVFPIDPDVFFVPAASGTSREAA